MNDRGGLGGLVPVGLVAVAAVIYSLVPGGGPSGPTPPQAPPGLAAARELPASFTTQDEPLRPLCEYLDMVGSRPNPEACAPRKPDEPNCPHDDLHPVRFLIATVPDPIDSHLAPSFDRAIDVILKAMQDSNYVLDRFYFPWKRDAESRWNVARLPSGAPDGFLSVNARTAPPDLHRNLPGTLLFRAQTPAGVETGEQLVVVFLVGETPTSGVQRTAFARALKSIVEFPARRLELPCVQPKDPFDRVQILGPYFSGSTDSLHHLIWSWNQKYKKTIEIVSGSATVDRNLDELQARKDEESRVGSVSFQATVISDRALSHAFNSFLQDRLGIEPKEKVAFFVEGGTSYGAGYKDLSSGKIRRIGQASVQQGERLSRFSISFPLHVSQLRAQYEKDQAQRSPASTSRAPRHSLELALDAPEGTTRDIVPTQDSRMAANIADLFLTSSVETIRREGVRFVGIVASDPRDVLFVARKIRENAANVTLFTFGADVLYTHPDYERYLRGMLVITPYPLLPVNQAWTGSDQVRVAFAGSSEEGIYNALRYLLRDVRDAGALLEYRAPLDPKPADRPPIWIMAVGRHGFWPVDVVPDYEKTEYVVKDPAPMSQRLPNLYSPPGGVLTFTLLEVALVGVIILYVVLRKQTAAISVMPANRSLQSALMRSLLSRVESVLSVWGTPAAREINRAYLVTLLVLCVFVQFTLGVYVWRSRTFFSYWPALGCAVLVLAGLIFLLVREIRLLVLAIRRAEVELRDTWRHGAIPAVFLAMIALALGRYLLDLAGLEKEDRLAFYARAFDLTSTLSPLVPLLLAFAVLALWALSNMRRAFLLELGEGSPADQPPLPTLIGIRELELSIQNLLTEPRTRVWAFLVPVLAILPFYKVLEFFDVMDGLSLSRLLRFLLLSGYFVIVFSFTLFVMLWIRVNRLLKRLALHPVVEAFRRLPDSVAASPWRMWSAVPSLTGLEASVSLLRVIVNLGPGPEGASELAGEAEQARALLNRAVIEAGRSFAASLPTQQRLRRLLSNVKDQLLKTLEVEWRAWPSSSPVAAPQGKPGDDESLGVPELLRRDPTAGGRTLWTRAAEEFVALRLSSYAHYVFLQMKALLTFVFIAFLLIVAAVSAYPFEPKHPVMALIWTVALGSVAIVAWAFFGMNRDLVLSYIGKTAPGQVTLSFEFLSAMAIYVVVPLLTLLATQFPDLGQYVFSVFSPAMKSLK